MPVDVPAAVISNVRLTSDYNVLSLAAAEVARQAAPGQFVMVKTALGLDPLLRRPFSIFEILRDSAGMPTGVSLLNKRVGVGTTLLYNDKRLGTVRGAAFASAWFSIWFGEKPLDTGLKRKLLGQA